MEVVATDRDDATIEIQQYDGTIGELDYRAWIAEKAIPTVPPNDCLGSVDISYEDNPDAPNRITLTLNDSLNLVEQLDDPSEDWLSIVTIETS